MRWLSNQVLMRGLTVRIESLENPGWLVTIEPGLRAEDAVLLTAGDVPGPRNGNVGGRDWVECVLRGGVFVGAGDPSKLEVIIEQFRTWWGEATSRSDGGADQRRGGRRRR
ncbi:MAG: Imm53 family immunity protein [Archangium sp.]